MLRSQKEQVRREVIELLDHQPVFLDTETTGLGPTDEVVDIAVVGFDGKVLVNTLVRPNISIPHEATQVHGITNEMVHSAPRFSEIATQLHSVLSGQYLGIYNQAYDLRLLQQSSRSDGIQTELETSPSFCIMELFARYYGQWDEYHQSYTWQNLAKAGRFFRIKLPNSHRALADAQLAREVFLRMAE